MTEYVSEYRRMVATLKVASQDFATLHHNVIGSPELHDWLGDLYDDVNEHIDELVEIGIQIGVEEIGIRESLDLYEPINVAFRNKQETVMTAVDRLERCIGVIAEVRETIETVDRADDVVSLLDDVKVDLRRWDYKFRMVLEGIN